MKINKVNLSKVTTYRFGGICENFITLEDPHEILNVPKNMDSSNTFVLGKGSNIAFSDNEYSGFVLKPNFDFINTVSDENFNAHHDVEMLPNGNILMMIWERITLNELLENGVAPEQARFVLPQGMYTEWYWTGSLAAYARFYKQRIDEHAQWEVREYAKCISDLVSPLFPVSWKELTI